MRQFFHPLLLSIVVIGAAELLSGCDGESKNPDVKVAEEAVGVKPDQDARKTVQQTRDVTVVKETKVIDNKTGQTISDKTESTPVKIVEEKQEKTEVNVNVGQTKSSAETKAPAK